MDLQQYPGNSSLNQRNLTDFPRQLQEWVHDADSTFLLRHILCLRNRRDAYCGQEHRCAHQTPISD